MLEVINLSDGFLLWLFQRMQEILNWGWNTSIYSGSRGSVSVMEFLLALSVISIVSFALLSFARTHTGDFISMHDSNMAFGRQARDFVRSHHETRDVSPSFWRQARDFIRSYR